MKRGDLIVLEGAFDTEIVRRVWDVWEYQGQTVYNITTDAIYRSAIATGDEPICAGFYARYFKRIATAADRKRVNEPQFAQKAAP